MTKRKNKKKRQNGSRVVSQTIVTVETISDVKTWLDRLRVNSFRAMELANCMSRQDLAESNDLFWALVKFIENVEESAVQLDKINKHIFPALVELGAEKWHNLKGMRSRLAHAFWNINPDILWATVKEDFPNLHDLLSTIVVIDKPWDDWETRSVVFPTDQLLSLPDTAEGQLAKPGQSIVILGLAPDGRVRVFRVGHEGTRTLKYGSNFDTRFSVYGRRRKQTPTSGLS